MRTLPVVFALAVGGCATVPSVPLPSAGPESVNGLPHLACPGPIKSSVNDYASNAPGVQDIDSATRALDGVQATDIVLRHGDSTAIVREGRAVWTGDWVKGELGYRLTYVTACSSIGIAGS